MYCKFGNAEPADFLYRNGFCDVLHPARQGWNKSVIVTSIKILDTAAFRRCQMRQQGSGCENFITVLLFQWK